jgi:hypothetical protein
MWPARKEMLAWSLSNVGAGTFFRYDPNSNTTTEAIIGGAPPIAGLVKITDAGLKQ